MPVTRRPEFRSWNSDGERLPSKPRKVPLHNAVITNRSRNQVVSKIVILPLVQIHSTVRTKEKKRWLVWRSKTYRQVETTEVTSQSQPSTLISDNIEDRFLSFQLEKFYVGNWHSIRMKWFQSQCISSQLRERVLRSLAISHTDNMIRSSSLPWQLAEYLWWRIFLYSIQLRQDWIF